MRPNTSGNTHTVKASAALGLLLVLGAWRSVSVEPGSSGAQGLDARTTTVLVSMESGQEYLLSSVDAGVTFDLDADGSAERVAWTAAASKIGFLVVDRNRNGRIDNGKEMVGVQSLAGAQNAFDGLTGLAALAGTSSPRGSLSTDDPLFHSLLVWTDHNHNGISEPAELIPLESMVSDFGLGYHLEGRRDTFGNVYIHSGWLDVRTEPGRNMALDPREEEKRRRPVFEVALAASQAPRKRQ
jgi:hypothetical protein